MFFPSCFHDTGSGESFSVFVDKGACMECAACGGGQHKRNTFILMAHSFVFVRLEGSWANFALLHPQTLPFLL